MSLQVFLQLLPEKQELPEVAGDTDCNTASVRVVPYKGCSGANNRCEDKKRKSMLLEGLISSDPSKRICMTFPVTAEHQDCTKARIFERTNPSEVKILYSRQ